VSYPARKSTTSFRIADTRETKVTESTLSSRLRRGLAVMAAALIVSAFGTGSAQAALLDHVGFKLDAPPLLNPDGTPILNPDKTYVDTPFVRQAGSHPDFTVDISVNPDGADQPLEALRDVDVDLPPGLVGNPNAVATCSPTELINSGRAGASCSPDTQVGVAEILTWADSPSIQRLKVGVFNIGHGPDVPARFGFNYSNVVGFINASVRPGDYGISSGSFSISQAEAVRSVHLTIWGVPADHSHDSLRPYFDPVQNDYRPTFSGPFGGPAGYYLDGTSGLIPAGHEPRPFLSMPTSCPGQPVSFTMRADSYEHPGEWQTETRSADEDGTPFQIERCDRLPFNPTVDVKPLSRQAGSPTGLDVDFTVPQSEDPDGLATAHVRDVKMVLPQGMSVSASSAAGLGACSPAQIGLGSNDAPTCPQSSKIGSVEIETPLLSETLSGDVILAKQNDNPFNSLLAMYIAVKGPGFYLKLPGKIEADPNTGQLTASFDNNPQLPFEHLHLQLAGGPQAPLSNPNACGTYAAQALLTPWSGTAPVPLSSTFQIDQGCNTGGFSPGLQAGASDSAAGASSQFTLQVTRKDGEQNLAALDVNLPEGLLAKLAGVQVCGGADAANGDCPAASRVGRTTVGAGSGPIPVYVPEAGKAPTAVYLAGPYKGAPYSLVVKVPAQAGPFDLGTVTVRSGIYIDPVTTAVSVKSDRLPQILQGIPIAYRDVRVEVDRPDFMVNPTSCKGKKVTSDIAGAEGASAHPSAPFAAANCDSLGFKPKLAVRFSGAPTHRGGHPALKAVLTMPKGNANIGRAQVTLPKTEFLENAHIRTICTRVQYAADNCPKGAIYGFAKAWSPLLDRPLEGPVYLRSSNHTLPDLVASLDGQIQVELAGRISSANKRLRTTFDFVPDAPVSKFVLKMQGGQKSLLVNNEELCRTKPRAAADFTGQNEKRSLSHPLVKVAGCGKKKK
jgi:hypothetical protein